MAEDTDDSQKTEEPTQKKLEDARKKGQVPTSREVNNWFAILAGTIWMLVFASGMMRDIEAALFKFIERPDTLPTDFNGLSDLLSGAFTAAGLAMLLPLTVVVAAALGGGLVQNGLIIATDRIRPKMEKISLPAGVKRLFSLKAIAEFIKGVLKLTIVGTVVTLLILPEFDGIARIPSYDLSSILALTHHLASRVFLAVLAVISVIAAVDFLYQKFEFLKTMRMSKQDMKEEFKQTEGDPMIKSRLRQIRTERARRRMMAAVPEADVVITNPTHFAVALKYEPGKMQAPRVVAKGADILARRIREIAEENDIMVMENAPLARALYAGVEIDEEVPEEHYRAVAEIIGYVFRLKKKVMPG